MSDAVRAAALTGDARLLMVATGALRALVAGEGVADTAVVNRSTSA